MNNKTTAIWLLTVAIVCSIIPSAWGQITNTQVNNIKTSLNIPNAAVITEEITPDTPGFQWTLDLKGQYSSGIVRLDRESGQVLSYVEYSSSQLPVAMTLEECQKTVVKLVEQLWPDKKEKLKLLTKPSRRPKGSGTFGDDVVYNFTFHRFEGQIPVEFDRAEINFNASTGRVFDIHLQWYNGKFQSPDGLIPISKAADKFATQVPIQLQWEKFPSGQGDLKFNLLPVYKASEYYAVDAVTGGLFASTLATELIPYRFDANDQPKIYPKFNPDKLLDHLETEKIARNFLKLPASYTLTKAENQWSWGEHGRFTVLSFQSPDGNYTYDITVDRISGKIIYLHNKESDDGGRVDYESGKSNAEAFCRLLGEEEYSNLKLVTNQLVGQKPSWEPHYSFIRYIYGIPYTQNGTYIVLSERTGNPLWYAGIWERNLNIPSLTSIMDINKLRSKLSQTTDMELMYRIIRNDGGQEETTRLIYVPKGHMLRKYNAINGTIVTSFRPNISGNESHWAYSDFLSLVSNGIIDHSKAIDPDKVISRGEFIKILMLSTYLPPKSSSITPFKDVNANNPFAPYLNQAHSKGIVGGSGGKFYPDKPLSRQEAAVLIHLAIKSEGRMSDQMTNWMGFPFLDESKIAPWAVNAVQSISKIGLMNGYKGYFNPTGSITWGEAAALLNKYANPNKL